MQGGFLQILMTTTGSKTLERAAAGGCIGGEENVPQDLKEIEVRFGEFVGTGDGGEVRLAGFGTAGEVVALRRGVVYGN